MRPLVLGVGSPIAGDDAIGYCVARVLEECSIDRDFDVVALQALEPGVAAFFEGRSLVVIVDAVDPSTLPEGARLAVYTLEPSRLDVEELAESLLDVSSHEPNPVNIALIARASGLFNGKVIVVGVRPYILELRDSLSGEACRLLPEATWKTLEVVGSKATLDTECIRRIAARECGCRYQSRN